MRHRLSVVALVLVLCGAASAAGDDLSVPVEKIAGGEPAKMMQQYWLEDSARFRGHKLIVTFWERFKLLKGP